METAGIIVLIIGFVTITTFLGIICWLSKNGRLNQSAKK